MAERRNINVSGLDFGAIALALFLVGWMAISARNWNSARDDCVTLLREQAGETRTPSGDDVRECAEELLD